MENRWRTDILTESCITDAKKKCKCGHTQLVIKRRDRDYVLCSYCGARLYYDDNKQKEYNRKVDKDNFIRGLKKDIELSKNNSSEVLNYE